MHSTLLKEAQVVVVVLEIVIVDTAILLITHNSLTICVVVFLIIQ
jgi:hypothetical protein